MNTKSQRVLQRPAPSLPAEALTTMAIVATRGCNRGDFFWASGSRTGGDGETKRNQRTGMLHRPSLWVCFVWGTWSCSGLEEWSVTAMLYAVCLTASHSQHALNPCRSLPIVRFKKSFDFKRCLLYPDIHSIAVNLFLIAAGVRFGMGVQYDGFAAFGSLQPGLLPRMFFLGPPGPP